MSADGVQRGRLEDQEVAEVGDEESVGWRCWIGERREVGEVEREIWSRRGGRGSRCSSGAKGGERIHFSW